MNIVLMVLTMLVGSLWHTDALARCAKFGGTWEASLFGEVHCLAHGQNIRVAPFSFIGPIDVTQRGCRFKYNDVQGTQRGVIKGKTIKIKKPSVHRALFNLFRPVSIKAKGRGKILDADRARIKIKSRLKGEVHGISANCSVDWTTRFVRLVESPTPPPPNPPGPPPPLPPPLGFNEVNISANYEWPDIGSILYAGGIAFVRPSVVEFPDLANQTGISIDITDREIFIMYQRDWLFSTAESRFDGLVISVVPPPITSSITGVKLTSTNIPGFNDSLLSFDDTHVYINQQGFSNFPRGSAIGVRVLFGGEP